MKIAACLTSKTGHYCSPPEYVVPMKRTLVPPGSGRTLGDFWTNDASQIGADYIADISKGVDGHTVKWTVADTAHSNPEYGEKILAAVQTMHHWHVEIGMPGLALLPARTDTVWMQGGTKAGTRMVGIHESCDAWLEVKGRFTFWRPIPIHEADAPAPEKKTEAKYFLRRWWPKATDEDLPPGFRLVSPGLAVGPEVAGPPGKPAKPQSAPFPSLIGFWADRLGRYDGEQPINVREFNRHFGRMGTMYVRTGEHRGVYTRRGA